MQRYSCNAECRYDEEKKQAICRNTLSEGEVSELPLYLRVDLERIKNSIGKWVRDTKLPKTIEITITESQ